VINAVTYLASGVLLDNAQELLKQPELSESDLLRRFKVTVRDAHKNGLTSIHDAGLDPTSLAFFNRYAFACCFRSHSLIIFFHKTSSNRHFASECFWPTFFIKFSINKIRIYGMSYFDEDKSYSGNTTHPVIGAGDGRLSARSIKIFGDGIFFLSR